MPLADPWSDAVTIRRYAARRIDREFLCLRLEHISLIYAA
jgi:hypothetical protein